MKSTDMKQTPETRKNFEEGWDAIFNKGEQRTIKESLTVAMGEVVSHLKGEIELPSRVYKSNGVVIADNRIQHTDAHNIATEAHADGHRGFSEMKKSMKHIREALDTSPTSDDVRMAASLLKLNDPDPKKSKDMKKIESLLTFMGVDYEFVDCPSEGDITHEDSDS